MIFNWIEISFGFIIAFLYSVIISTKFRVFRESIVAYNKSKRIRDYYNWHRKKRPWFGGPPSAYYGGLLITPLLILFLIFYFLNLISVQILIGLILGFTAFSFYYSFIFVPPKNHKKWIRDGWTLRKLN